MLADMATVLLIASTLLRESSIWGFYTFRGAFFVETFRVGSQHMRVDSGRGQNRTLRLLLALWPPVFAGEQDVGPPKG